MQVKIPFIPEARGGLLSGYKQATSRTRKFGDVGDTFEAFNASFIITVINKRTLEDVALNFWNVEGVFSPFDFMLLWKRLHPRTGWQSTKIIYFHQFRRVNV